MKAIDCKPEDTHFLPHILTKSELDWIKEQIIIELDSSHQCLNLKTKPLWLKQQHILNKAQQTLKLPPIVWTWTYDLSKEKLEMLKKLFAKTEGKN